MADDIANSLCASITCIWRTVSRDHHTTNCTYSIEHSLFLLFLIFLVYYKHCNGCTFTNWRWHCLNVVRAMCINANRMPTKNRGKRRKSETRRRWASEEKRTFCEMLAWSLNPFAVCRFFKTKLSHRWFKAIVIRSYCSRWLHYNIAMYAATNLRLTGNQMDHCDDNEFFKLQPGKHISLSH